MGSDRKTAILTGVSGNLGPVWYDVLYGMGYDVWTIDLPTDISDRNAVMMSVQECEKRYGVPSVVVNNAAIDNPPGSKASFFGDIERILAVNLLGACYVCEATIPLMQREGGVIINIGSIQGRVGADWRNYPPGFEKPVGYNLSKAALEQLSRSITVQYGRYGIRSCVIAFGPYDNGKFTEEFKVKFLNNIPMQRFVGRESLQSALRFAIECPEFAGQTALVDGGYTVL